MKKSIFLILTLVLSLMIIPAVKAEKLVPYNEGFPYEAKGKTDLTSSSASTMITPKVGIVDDDDTYNVKLEWGSMTYNYVKQSDDTYKWVPTKDEVISGKDGANYLIVETDSNYISVSNESNKNVIVELSWKSLINGVEASYSAVDSSNNPFPIAGKSDTSTKIYSINSGVSIRASIELIGGDVADVTDGASIGYLTVSLVTV